MRKHGICKFIVLVMLLQISLLAYLNPQLSIDNSTNPQQKRPSLRNLRNSAQIEYYEISGTKNNTTSIQIELPDSSWNITEIELNFTNISQHRQLRTIEGNVTESTFRMLHKSSSTYFRISYGQEIFFPEYTELYGIYFYGCKLDLTPEEAVKVMVFGFDDNTHIYNSTVYYNQTINISTSPDWYFQDFSTEPKYFYADSYYFVINGYAYRYEAPENVPRYIFFCNEINPQYSSLYWGERDYFGFDAIEPPGDPFLIKLLERVNRTYFPKELNMQAIINENFYTIGNGTHIGEGNLSIAFLNFKPEGIYYDIPIATNDETIDLVYNLSYYIKLRKNVQSVGLNGESNADNESKVFFGISPEFFYFTIFIIILIFISALFSYQAIKKIQIKKRLYREKFYNKFNDVMNLDYVIVSDKKSGLSIYEQVIRDKNFDPALISGFLQAIRVFGLELTGSEEHSQTIKLEYQKSKILMSEFKNYRIINIFEDTPSKEFTYALESLSKDIDKYFGSLLDNFDGELTRFVGIKDLIEKHFQISLLSPLRIVMHNEVRLNSNEKSMVKHVSDVMKKRDLDHFYISYLISDREFNPKKAEIIFNLISKRIFQSIY